jgi:hypothetical protein
VDESLEGRSMVYVGASMFFIYSDEYIEVGDLGAPSEIKVSRLCYGYFRDFFTNVTLCRM